MKKFKSGDFVENIHTGKIEMINRIEQSELYIDDIVLFFVPDYFYDIGYSSDYRIISHKKIKFNLKNKKK